MNGEVLVFPLDTPNQKVVDLKQYLAAQQSLKMLQQEIDTAEEQGYGKGYVAELQKRATECQAIINKTQEKYGSN
jgi:hypothetical protein